MKLHALDFAGVTAGGSKRSGTNSIFESFYNSYLPFSLYWIDLTSRFILIK